MGRVGFGSLQREEPEDLLRWKVRLHRLSSLPRAPQKKKWEKTRSGSRSLKRERVDQRGEGRR